ncbi:MAG: CHASE4 domain-containing protein [Methanobacteriota archaeon]
MFIKSKVLLTLVITLLMLVGTSHIVTQKVIMGEFLRQERADAITDVDRAIAGIENAADKVNGSCRDWATWDDTYLFMKTGNAEYIETNLDNINPFVNLQVNIFLILGFSNEVVFAKAVDLEHETVTDFPEGVLSSFLSSPAVASGSEMHGLLAVPEGVLLFATNPILLSNGTGPSAGTFTMARYLDDAEVALIAGVSHISIEVHIPDNGSASPNVRDAWEELAGEEQYYTNPVNGSVISGYALMRDVDGLPVLMVETFTPRDTSLSGRASIFVFNIASIIGALCIVAILMLMLERLVLSRMTRLGREVGLLGSGNSISTRVSVDGHDEITELSKRINAMLANIDDFKSSLTRTNDGLRSQARQSKTIGRALIGDIGAERASGILYESGWTVALAEAKAMRGEYAGNDNGFAEKFFERSSAALSLKVSLDKFGAGTRIRVSPALEGDTNATLDGPELAYAHGYIAAVLSVELGKPVGLRQSIPEVTPPQGVAFVEYVTRELEPYEREVYRI